MTKSYKQVNVVMFEGNAGADPEYFANETTKKASFTLYNTRRWTKDGEAKEATTRINVVAWGAQAQFVRDYVTKGGAYEVHGSLSEQVWQDKETEKNRCAHSIRLQELFFRGRKPAGSANAVGEEE